MAERVSIRRNRSNSDRRAAETIQGFQARESIDMALALESDHRTHFREVVSIHIGQAGIQTGAATWNLNRYENNLNRDGTLKTDEEGDFSYSFHKSCDVLFHERNNGTYSPRALFIDSEPKVINECVRTSSLKNLFIEEYNVNGKQDASNCFARGRFAVTKEIHQYVVTALRRNVEQCDALAGVQLTSSNCGGTGSGYGTSLLTAMSEIMPKVSKHHHLYVPSPHVSNGLLEPYNSILYFSQTKDLVNVNYIYDNESCYNLVCPVQQCSGVMTSYKDLNHLIAQVQSGMTCNLRWNHELEIDIGQIETNLVPFPNINKLTCGLAVLANAKSSMNVNTYGLTAEAFLNRIDLNSIDTTTGQYIAVALLYRGNVDPIHVHEAMLEVNNTFKVDFVPWVPTGFKIGISPRKIAHDEENAYYACPDRSLVKVANHTSITGVTRGILDRYNALLERRAFCFWYVSEGMEEGEFVDAAETIVGEIKSTLDLLGAEASGDDSSKKGKK